MQKTTTPLNKTDLFPKKEKILSNLNLEPTKETLLKIIQFSSTYRVEKINENQFIELFLN